LERSLWDICRGNYTWQAKFLSWSFESGDILARSVHFDSARSPALKVEWREKMI
jgi:hypothetical protein